MPFVTSKDGTNIYFEVHGMGEPLLLVSGQGSDHKSWDIVRDDFCERYTVILYDHRGTGQSDKPHSPLYTTKLFAEDAIAVLDHLDIQRAHAYGISMGGRVCQWLGISHGHRIGALILGCTTPGNLHGVRRPEHIDSAMATGDFLNPVLLATMVSPEWIEGHPEYLPYAQERFKNPIPDYARRMHYAASEGHEAWDLLPLIKAPTLVIHGSDDLINMTANAPLLVQRIPNSELHIVQGGRHGFALEYREEAFAVVNDFLERHRLTNCPPYIG